MGELFSELNSHPDPASCPSFNRYASPSYVSKLLRGAILAIGLNCTPLPSCTPRHLLCTAERRMYQVVLPAMHYSPFSIRPSKVMKTHR